MNIYSYCNIDGMTDVGCKRPANEDWLDRFECANGLVAVVCDGMGGHVGGQEASHTAVAAIRSLLESNYYDDPRVAIVEACNAANNAILQKGTVRPELRGMGSTCVMVIVRDGKVYIGSIGDSRVYIIRDKIITQLTKDQSFVQTLVDQGLITPEEAEHHPRKNEITNALGLESMQPATVLPEPITPEAGDCFLLCSDGLSGMVSDKDILKIVSNQTGMSQHERVVALINAARANGGLDNITCQIVEFSVSPNDVSDKGNTAANNISSTENNTQDNSVISDIKKRNYLIAGGIALVAVILSFFCFKGCGNSNSSKPNDAPVQTEPEENTSEGKNIPAPSSITVGSDVTNESDFIDIKSKDCIVKIEKAFGGAKITVNTITVNSDSEKKTSQKKYECKVNDIDSVKVRLCSRKKLQKLTEETDSNDKTSTYKFPSDYSKSVKNDTLEIIYTEKNTLGSEKTYVKRFCVTTINIESNDYTPSGSKNIDLGKSDTTIKVKVGTKILFVSKGKTDVNGKDKTVIKMKFKTDAYGDNGQALSRGWYMMLCKGVGDVNEVEIKKKPEEEKAFIDVPIKDVPGKANYRVAVEFDK